LVTTIRDYDYKKKYGEFKIYLTKYNVTSGLFEEPFIIEHKENNLTFLDYEVTVSENKEFVLVNAKIRKKKEKLYKYDFVVIDKELKTVWNRDVKWKVVGYAYTSPWLTHLTNKGDVAFIIATRSFADSGFHKKDDKLFIYSSDSEQPYQYEGLKMFRPDWRSSIHKNIFVDYKNGDLEVFYDNKVGQDKKQVFYGSVLINADNHKVIENLTLLSPEMQTLFLDKEDVEKVESQLAKGKRVEMPRFIADFSEVHINNDGSILMIYEDRTFTQDDNRFKPYYEMGNIFVLKFSSDRKFLWGVEINKEQVSRYSFSRAGYILYEFENGNLGFIYNKYINDNEDGFVFFNILDIQTGELEECMFLESEGNSCYFYNSYSMQFGNELFLDFIDEREEKDVNIKSIVLNIDE
jgi:hypothetical protein